LRDFFIEQFFIKIQKIDFFSTFSEKKYINMNTSNILLLGDVGVGKTSFVNRLTTEKFSMSYKATVGIKNTSLNSKGYNLEFYDVAGQEILLGDSPLPAVIDEIFIFFDLTRKSTFKSVGEYYDTAKTLYDQTPITLIGTKVDVKDRKVTPKQIKLYLNTIDADYFDHSAKSCYNFEAPIKKYSN